MELLLKRDPNPDYTIGKLFIDGVYECFILEDPIREKKIYGQTAIPAGRYKIVITYSEKFKRNLPLLLNVPNYEGVRIHSGNDVDDTEGCLLTGQYRSKNGKQVLNSRMAFEPLFEKLVKALKKEEVWITIIN